MESFFSDYVLGAGYILLLVAVVAAVGGPIINAISNPKTIMKSIIGLAIFIVIFLIGKFTAGYEVTALYEKFNITASLSNQIGALLFVMYTLTVIALVGIVVNEITNFLK